MAWISVEISQAKNKYHLLPRQNNEALKSYQDLEVPMGESFLQFDGLVFQRVALG